MFTVVSLNKTKMVSLATEHDVVFDGQVASEVQFLVDHGHASAARVDWFCWSIGPTVQHERT